MKENRNFALAVWMSVLFAIALVSCAAQENLPSSPSSAEVPPNPGPAGVNGPSQFQQRRSRYLLQAADTFDLLFEFSPELNQTMTVQPDGYVTLRGVGDLHVAGQTVVEATESLRTAYRKILHNPSITIVLKDFQKPYFIVDGQVGKPGKYELRGDTTTTEGIAMAGGFLPSAKHSQVLLFRRSSDQWVQAKIINIKKMAQRGNLEEDLHLQPGDMLFVPKNFFSKIDPFLPRAALGLYSRSF